MKRALCQLAVPLLWLAWLAYWQFAAYGVKPVRRRETVASRWGNILPLAIGALLIAIPYFPGWLGQPVCCRSWLTYSPPPDVRHNG